MPSHRARAANPRVKMVDDPQLTELVDATPARARVSSSRAGPGRNSQLEVSTPRRSSLLTYDKGKRSLRSVKKAEPVQVEQRAGEKHSPYPDADESAEIPGLSIPDASVVVVPPTAAELLRLAGADEKSVADLVDFQDDTLVTPTLAYPEDTIPPRSPSQPPTAAAAATTAGTGVVSVLRQSLATVKETLFPSASPAVPGQPHKWRISDANSTIFGALPTAKFFLSFDSSAAAPVRLLCASPDTPDAPTPTPTLDEIIKTQAKVPVGQFYQQEYAHNLLNTLRSIGPSAKVVLDDSEASDDQRRHYERFQTKLRAGELVSYLLLLVRIPVLNLS
ncbi:Chromo domain-containing protein [Salix suchowensis]|nr:Chromo domain-containing protein [Salix suchowensis]